MCVAREARVARVARVAPEARISRLLTPKEERSVYTRGISNINRVCVSQFI